jgi:hypothetical protein
MKKVQDTYRVSEAQARASRSMVEARADREGGVGGQPITTLGSQRAQHHDSHQRGGEELAEQQRGQQPRLT